MTLSSQHLILITASFIDIISISGLVVEYIVAIDVTRARFPAGACNMARSLSQVYAQQYDPCTHRNSAHRSGEHVHTHALSAARMHARTHIHTHTQTHTHTPHTLTLWNAFCFRVFVFFVQSQKLTVSNVRNCDSCAWHRREHGQRSSKIMLNKRRTNQRRRG